VESLVLHSFPQHLREFAPKAPFPRMTFDQAIDDFGTDKPDMRIPWRFYNCTEDITPYLDGSFPTEPVVKMFIAKSAINALDDSLFDEWNVNINTFPFKQPYKLLRTSDEQWFNKKFQKENFIKKYRILNDDIAVFCWGHKTGVNLTLGHIRNLIGEVLGLRSQPVFDFLWIVNFPLFSATDVSNLESSHHPFTAPILEHKEMLKQCKSLHQVRAQHYDLVLNGEEIGGGSIRIEDPDLQKHVLEKILRLETASLSHFLEALSYGAPPHGGFALGLDRYLALLNSKGNKKAYSVRNVIAFPKNSSGQCMMTESPSNASAELLNRYSMKLTIDNK